MSRTFVRANGNYMTLDPADFTFSGDFTMLVWVRHTTSGTAPSYCIAIGDLGSPNSLTLFLGTTVGTNDWRAFIYDSTGDGFGSGITSPSVSSLLDTWVPMIVRRSGTDISFYVVSRTNELTAGSFGPTFAPTTFLLGAQSLLDADRFFEGEIAHLAHYTSALSDAAVDSLFAGANPRQVALTYGVTLQRYFSLDATTGDEIDVISGTVTAVATDNPAAGTTSAPVSPFNRRNAINSNSSRSRMVMGPVGRRIIIG